MTLPKKFLKLAYLFDPEYLGGDGVFEHAAYELLPLQLLILVLVAHVVHLSHHCRQVNLQYQTEIIKASRQSTFYSVHNEGQQFLSLENI